MFNVCENYFSNKYNMHIHGIFSEIYVYMHILYLL